MRFDFSLGARTAAVFAAFAVGLMGACGGTMSEGSPSSEAGTTPDAPNGGSVTTGGRADARDAGAGGSIQADGGGIAVDAGGLGDAGGAAGSGSDSIFSCADPQPVLGPHGEPTGYTLCAEGWMHREARVECASRLPRAEFTCPDPPAPGLDSCVTDRDCTRYPNGRCTSWESASGLVDQCFCIYGCTSDDECTRGQICVCGDPIGSCVEATCETDSDCDDLLCASYSAVMQDHCGRGFACQTTRDVCMGHDCETGSVCGYENRRRVCTAEWLSCF